MSTCWSSMFADRNDWNDGEVSILSQRICRTCHNKRKKFEEKLDQAHWLFGGVPACAILTAILSPSTSPAMRARYCQASSSPTGHSQRFILFARGRISTICKNIVERWPIRMIPILFARGRPKWKIRIFCKIHSDQTVPFARHLDKNWQRMRSKVLLFWCPASH